MTLPETRLNRSFNQSYSSRRDSNSDTVADISVAFENPPDEETIGAFLSTWLTAIFALPHHATGVVASSDEGKINTNFALNFSSRRQHSAETALDVNVSFDNPVDRQNIYDRLNLWLRAAGIALAFPQSSTS